MAETAIFFIPEVFARSKFDALDQIFTKDAHPAPPGAPMISGRPAINSLDLCA